MQYLKLKYRRPFEIGGPVRKHHRHTPRAAHLHWLGQLGKQQTIVAFDLGDQAFSETCLPVNNVKRRNTLGILSGKLCVM
ncbi:hypothetical protein OSB04_018054 [Centaurea solstitialis]|uniref:Uncharacterized protein n=1 Tax=Centaurea solstitialis TaxID=347529 RepID=A0AA38T423_9ASTR|nr:hypothetical protein OSB04_018054 [Centaurea solstitialis]